MSRTEERWNMTTSAQCDSTRMMGSIKFPLLRFLATLFVWPGSTDDDNDGQNRKANIGSCHFMGFTFSGEEMKRVNSLLPPSYVILIV